MLITDPVGCPHSYVNKDRFISCVFTQDGRNGEVHLSNYYISYSLVAKAGNVIKYISRDIDIDLTHIGSMSDVPRLKKANQVR